jgi:hypothetical protein
MLAALKETREEGTAFEAALDQALAAANLSLSPPTASSKKDRARMEAAVGKALRKMSGKGNVADVAPKVIMAGGGVSLTVWVLYWLFRGGALVTTLLSSVSVLNEIDPLVVVARRRKAGKDKAPVSKVELLFNRSDGGGAGAEAAA